MSFSFRHSIEQGPFLAAVLASILIVPASHATTPSEMLAQYSARAGRPAEPARGQQLFSTRHGKEWSCASCHGTTPTQAGKHASTGKSINALAPAFHPARFTDQSKVEKWFRRNCNDVLGRECTDLEKADVLSWLITLKP